MTVEFRQPEERVVDRVHHDRAAAGNAAVADEAIRVLRETLSGTAPLDRLLLKAAAGAGKSFILRKLVADAVERPECDRVVITAFTNKQIHPLAAALGRLLGADRVCLFVGKDRYQEVPEEASSHSTVVSKASDIPAECEVVISTAHRLGTPRELDRLAEHLGPGHNGETVFDVLFVDEAWQLPHHRFDRVAKAAPITVGVGDVGQLPPLEVGANPWRGDPGFNPYRAWPTDYDGDERTWSVELPAVWRPAAGHLELWRAFYPEWKELDCVAAPGDRALVAEELSGESAAIWRQVGTGVPTLLEVDGLPEPEAADVDPPLLATVESLLDELFAAGFVLEHAEYDGEGAPTGNTLTARPGEGSGDPLVAILATRNQAVDDATDVAERLRRKYSLRESEVVASTVDSWQGQTNRLTVAIHPLSGASRLDEFNSAFGRLAVTCTRATHGLLMLTRPGIDGLLGEAPVRPGTPFGEPGNRHLPRQTHQRILGTFARGTLTTGSDQE
ncbi:hypothetical protein J2S53_003670 [Actinopolyspora lacussalsi]|nr:hypothetical protein [Actinopolyspora lacussalsi]